MPRIEVDATELHRIMGCGGYLNLNSVNHETTPTPERVEGIAAHKVIQLVLNGTVQSADELIDRNVSGFIVTGDMVEYLTPHIDHIKTRGLQVFTECDLSWYTPNGDLVKCRADAFSYDQNTATYYIDEPKYGWKIADPFWQMMGYAIGAFVRYNLPVREIVLTVHQPRPFHADGPIRVRVLNGSEAAEYHRQIIDRLANLPPTVTTGPHCYKCNRAAFCPAARQAALAAVDISTESYHENFTKEEVAHELDLLERAEQVLKTRFDAIKSLAVSLNGVPGWTFKQSYGNRKWIEGANAEALSMLTGISVDKLVKSELISPAQAEKAGVDKITTSMWTETASRGFTLVRTDTDKDAKKLFSQQKE